MSNVTHFAGALVEITMLGLEASGIDLIHELQLRNWARTNYVPQSARANDWHPVVLDEMRRRDEELGNADRFIQIDRSLLSDAS